MEIRVLQYFWTIANVGTISGAAEILHITQPTLSRQIKDLETELQTPLFTRHHNRLELTSAGIYLRSRAEEILTLTRQTEQTFIDQRNQLYSGKVTIGCVEADNTDTMAQAIESLIQDYPQVHFSITTGAGDLIKEQLEKGLIDLALMLEPIDTKRYFSLRLPRQEQWGLLVAKDSPLSEHATITPDDLIDLPLIISQRQDVHSMLNDWFDHPNLELSIVGEYNLIFNTLPFVLHHVGVTLTVVGVTRTLDQSRLTFVPLAPMLETNCVLAWRKNKVLTPIASELIKRFKKFNEESEA
ncbi:LysR family transcriptional regulator [Levilactobacillus hammesii]|uniref:LysR family transcriptional regulator n=1 Tax=Levilactobacillus hammesii DSM 16381 TaxID=1423753 RepID=A0A0R1V6Z1_9LACO|nr:LysR family transcriptional regulator [Levilactobacillus hammesii]KRL97579.1 LysR family transcriptional regulator [Levilactobacillus hammesii DSM 16381]